MDYFLIILSIIALIISKIALFRFIINSFQLELKNQRVNERYVSREARRIKIPPKDESAINIESKKNILLQTTLIWTMSIGELVGYIFLILIQLHFKFVELAINAIVILLFSLLYQILTMGNAWLKKRTDLLLRIKFQSGLVILGAILISIADSHVGATLEQSLHFIVLLYLFTVIIAIFSMLIDALIAEQGVHNFDYNFYSRVVILVGLIIGSGFYFSLK